MNKPVKIVPPEEAEDTEAGQKKSGGSLLERAGNAFGFDRLLPAKLPAALPEARKRLPTPRPARTEVEPTAAPAQPPAEVVVEAPIPEAAPVSRRRAEPDGQAVRLPTAIHPVSRDALRASSFIDPDGDPGALLEEFRIVKRQVLATIEDEGTARSRRVLVASPHSGEGKTFCACNLAIAMAAERDIEVVLVDADVAKPSIAGKLGLEAGEGLMDALADPALAVETLVMRTDIDNLYVLPAGKRTQRDAEYLASERTWEVLGRLTRGAPNRVVIFDSPPALAASPAAELAKHVGQTLLVARADETPRVALEDAVDLLGSCPDIKLLLNDATFSPSGRSFGQYYGMGG